MTEQTEGLKPLDALCDRLDDLGARLGRGEVIGQTPYAVACWHDIAAVTGELRRRAASRALASGRAYLNATPPEGASHD